MTENFCTICVDYTSASFPLERKQKIYRYIPVFGAKPEPFEHLNRNFRTY